EVDHVARCRNGQAQDGPERGDVELQGFVVVDDGDAVAAVGAIAGEFHACLRSAVSLEASRPGSGRAPALSIQLRSVWVVGCVGLEPTTKGLCVPLRLSPPVSGSWSGLCLAF